jgi:lipopolysaccharide biosynthesis protein
MQPCGPVSLPAPLTMIKPIAFYLPQYHPIPENDLWWGKGFTEWHNVRNAKPQFEGHYQPHIPHGTIGYYDLRDRRFLIRQHEIAQRHNIFGFCYYYYFFNGKTLLDLPLKIIRNTPEIRTNYCLCWANENWTRAWYGQNKEVLISNSYDESKALDFIKAISPYFQDDRYIRIDGKPLLLVYAPELIEDARVYAEIWRAHARSLGFDGIYLASVEARTINMDPATYGFDAAVEFAPDWTQAHLLSERTSPHRIFDYKETIKNMILKKDPAYTRFKCVFPSWDNAPRYKNAAITFINSNPGAFKYFLQAAIEKTKNNFAPENEFLFINAWNEWGEGCHLEPDQANGYAYLQVVREVLQAFQA